MHQAGIRQTAVAANFCGLGEQACAQDGAGNDHDHCRLGAKCRHQVGADLHDQQTDPQTETKFTYFSWAREKDLHDSPFHADKVRGRLKLIINCLICALPNRNHLTQIVH